MPALRHVDRWPGQGQAVPNRPKLRLESWVAKALRGCSGLQSEIRESSRECEAAWDKTSGSPWRPRTQSWVVESSKSQQLARPHLPRVGASLQLLPSLHKQACL